jgi:hypothetical protein
MSLCVRGMTYRISRQRQRVNSGTPFHRISVTRVRKASRNSVQVQSILCLNPICSANHLPSQFIGLVAMEWTWAGTSRLQSGAPTTEKTTFYI